MNRPSGRMSQARGSRDSRSPVTLAGNRTGAPNLTPPAVVIPIAIICAAVAAPVNTSSSPDADHVGWKSTNCLGTWYAVPAGNDCTKTPRLTSVGGPPVAYASHLPSGENTDPIVSVEVTPANAKVVLSASERIWRVHAGRPADTFTTASDKWCPSGDQDSGTCSSPAAAVVSRSATPVPSAR